MKSWFKNRKPTRKLKQANPVQEYSENLSRMSSKSIVIILSYTISKLVSFFETLTSEQLDPWCSMQTYHCSNQPQKAFIP